jgi:cell division protein FtsW (lipid II flippase)
MRGDSAQKGWDWLLVGCVTALLVIVFLVIYSATFEEAGRLWQKQMLFAAMGLVAMAGVFLIPSRFFYAAAYPLYLVSLLPLLYIILFKADSVERWIALPGGFNLQPSELGIHPIPSTAPCRFNTSRFRFRPIPSLTRARRIRPGLSGQGTRR